ncbi:lethal(3)malignant brain tumor-like protein 4 [Trichonephila clavata]|uniref:Lethal(3)malignant brain tumor-like protein 4 n=1 Tax=Trichonephila clavata TaxID=2740835 RepID=A0A8X6H7A6_TRICU|nr:lethal(3)malignant brain tumor-like protein 4 [Trichonephila clavata]
MKLEAVDKRNPGLIRVATIADKTDHNLLIHFDGWSSMYDYWVDDNSPDIHPIHWCAKTGHPLEPPLVITSDQTGPCPTTGCLGQGHIKGPKYTSHHSAFGCPYSPINLNKIDTIGQDRVIITKESLNEFTKKISDQGGATDGLRLASAAKIPHPEQLNPLPVSPIRLWHSCFSIVCNVSNFNIKLVVWMTIVVHTTIKTLPTPVVMGLVMSKAIFSSS